MGDLPSKSILLVYSLEALDHVDEPFPHGEYVGKLEWADAPLKEI